MQHEKEGGTRWKQGEGSIPGAFSAPCQLILPPKGRPHLMKQSSTQSASQEASASQHRVFPRSSKTGKWEMKETNKFKNNGEVFRQKTAPRRAWRAAQNPVLGELHTSLRFCSGSLKRSLWELLWSAQECLLLVLQKVYNLRIPNFFWKQKSPNQESFEDIPSEIKFKHSILLHYSFLLKNTVMCRLQWTKHRTFTETKPDSKVKAFTVCQI